MSSLLENIIIAPLFCNILAVVAEIILFQGGLQSLSKIFKSQICQQKNNIMPLRNIPEGAKQRDRKSRRGMHELQAYGVEDPATGSWDPGIEGFYELVKYGMDRFFCLPIMDLFTIIGMRNSEERLLD